MRNQKWVQRLALPVVAALGAVMLTTTTAEAVPSKCSTSRVDKDTFTGTCRSGTGTWRLRVDCDRAEPDSFSSWLKPGRPRPRVLVGQGARRQHRGALT
ncbi:hypothetical protein [Streptomyces cremeus]|uniref:hypothetical protein n=1 Tax=Streptomyces cremeus TaxID=66881 RepID=UPI0031E6CB1F